MAKMNVYLNFNGNTEEAFQFYRSVFGGDFTGIFRFKDGPDPENISEEEKNKIMHIALPIGSNMLMGTDSLQSYQQKVIPGTNTYISLDAESEEEARRIYKKLSEGGKIGMELQKMFWGDLFASFSDKYQVRWMINYDLQKT